MMKRGATGLKQRLVIRSTRAILYFLYAKCRASRVFLINVFHIFSKRFFFSCNVLIRLAEFPAYRIAKCSQRKKTRGMVSVLPEENRVATFFRE